MCFSLRKTPFSVHGSPLMCNLLVFTVISNPFMSGVNIDEPGFTAPAGSAPLHLTRQLILLQRVGRSASHVPGG